MKAADYSAVITSRSQTLVLCRQSIPSQVVNHMLVLPVCTALEQQWNS